ncbi:MAG: hypothetical protein QNJ44_24305 [Rhodobacter sp.]|nr:hypothetical protein [Rhodobacter sp.]
MREYWATYSVKDHLEERAFVADVMLYDRIVVPHPPDDKERARWAGNGWDPDRLDNLLEIIGPDRSRKIPWDDNHKQEWQDRMAAADHLNRDAFQATRDILTSDLPPYVTGVQADLAFSDAEALAAGTGLRPHSESKDGGTASLATVLGKRFLAPAAKSYPDQEGALRSALALSADSEFKKKRKAYYRWQREFLEECARLDTVWDQRDRDLVIAKAAEEMHDLIADEERALRRQKIKLGALFTLTVTGSGLALVGGGPITPVGLAGAFVSVGAFLVDKLLEPEPDKPAPAAFFTSANRHFGWSVT